MYYNTIVFAQARSIVYLIPGQGADYRLFQKIVSSGQYEWRYIHHEMPDKRETMHQYARRLSRQIDQTQTYSIVGVSLGGMIATEMSTFLSPDKIVIVSSAKHKYELPKRYRFQQKVPIYKIVGPKLAKFGAIMLQPIVEPDRKKHKDTFRQMLRDKQPLFLKRTIEMIIEWQRISIQANIIHIHGTKDHTIPIRNVQYDYSILNGSHLMTLTDSEATYRLIDYVLKN